MKYVELDSSTDRCGVAGQTYTVIARTVTLKPAYSDKDQLQALYGQCDSFGSFRGALEHAGCHVARGDRRGVVIVDQEGKAHSLSRQLSKEQRAQLKDQLKEIDLSELPDAGEMQARIRQAQAEQQREAQQQPEKEAEERQQETQEGKRPANLLCS